MPVVHPEENRPRTAARAVLIAARRPDESDAAFAARCVEMERLASTLGVTIVAREVQRRPPSPRTFLGVGRLEAVARWTAPREGPAEADLALVDASLTPGQLRAVEDALQVEVLDRTAVILEIFERRAGTRQAQLEVEIARLRYQLPRVREVEAERARTGGGGGRGERGHTSVALEKERIRERIARLERELADHRARGRAERERRTSVFQVALVGYTNAGKSSVAQGLTGREAGVEDKLFATLGTRVRQLRPPATPAIVVADTVGFVRDLPHELVASFRSTLDQARDADLILLLLDASDPDWRAQLRVTRDTLAEIGADAVPTRLVANKVDQLDADARAALAAELPGALLVSALDDADVDRLRSAIVDARDLGLGDETLLLPFDQGATLGEVHERAVVLEQTATTGGHLLRVRASAADLDRWRPPADPVVTPADALRRAEQLGLPSMSADAAFDDSGLDFRVLHAVTDDRPWILRLPRRPDVFARSRIEGRALRLVRDRLPVAVPAWQVHTPEVIAYPRLPGTPAWTVGAGGVTFQLVDPADPQPAFLDGLADVLAALQAVPRWAIRAAALPEEPLDELRATRRRRIDAVREALGANDALVARWHRWLDDDDGWPTHTALMHGDLHPGHLLLGDDARVVGILAWTEARRGDPSRDFVFVYGCFGRAALDRVLARFAAVGGRTWPGMAAHVVASWAYYPVDMAWWGLRHDQPEVIGHARAVLATAR